MKYFLLALFVAVAIAAPAPLEEDGELELIVNGVPDGHALELGDVLDITLQKHVEGELESSSNVLHPYTAVGLAQAAAAAAEAEAAEVPAIPDATLPEGVVIPDATVPEVVVPEPEGVALPEPAVPEVAPEGVAIPEPAVPEVVPEGVGLPEPAVPEVVPEGVAIPEPALPEVAPEPAVPEVDAIGVVEGPAAPVTGEVYNDGLVQIHVNGPQDDGIVATLSSWFSLVVNYISNGVQTTQQIV